MKKSVFYRTRDSPCLEVLEVGERLKIGRTPSLTDKRNLRFLKKCAVAVFAVLRFLMIGRFSEI